MAQRTVRRSAGKPVKTRSYHHGDLRRALLDAALDILATEGDEALSLREAARRAGVTHAAPYRHFLDKEALLAAVAEEGFLALAAAMRERLAPASGWERLRQAGIAYVLFAVRHPAHYRVMFGSAFLRSGDPTRHPSLREAGQAAYAVLTSTIVECHTQGIIEGDVDQIGLTAWALVHGLAMLFVDNQLSSLNLGADQAEQVTAQVAAVLERGLAKR